MQTIANILVASDLSPRADFALARAARLAQQHGAALTALAVVDRAPFSKTEPAEALGRLIRVPPERLDQQIIGAAEKVLRERLAPLLGEGARFGTEVRYGRPFLEIIHTARSRGSDLVVLGAHGAQFVRDLLLGTTAERVVRKGDRPVLVVKQPAEAPYRKVLVAVDFSDTACRALQLAARLAPDAELTVLHAYELWYEMRLLGAGMVEEEVQHLREVQAREVRAQMKEFIARCDLGGRKVRVSLREGYPATAIVRAARRPRADLIAIGTHGMSGMRHVLLGSVAERVLREAPCDVLAVRPQAAEFELP